MTSSTRHARQRLRAVATVALGLAAVASGFVVPSVRPPRPMTQQPQGIHTLPSDHSTAAARIALMQRASATIDKAEETKESTLPPQGDPLARLAQDFEAFYNRALDGKPAQLKGLFAPGATWEGIPLADGRNGLQEALDVLDQGRAFMVDPRLVVTGARPLPGGTVALDWQLSGTWPFPYRPRVRAAGTSVVTLDAATGKIRALAEKWAKPWWQVALAQAAPKPWDLWHLYLTPPAEKPLYRVVEKLPAVEIREYYPRLVIELEVHDARPDLQYTEYAWVLPDFAFTDELKLQGRAQYRETYVTTSPIESCVESVQWAPPSPQAGGQPGSSVPAKRIRFHIPVPSHLGFDPATLPQPPVKGTDTAAGEAGRYVLQPRRFVAVRTFKGQSQTEQYGTARRWLLSWVQKEGLKTAKNAMGRSQVWVQQHNMKAGFNMAGNFCLGIYEQPSYSDWGEIAVEVEEEARFSGEDGGQ